jgi:hypothetical protein
MDHGKNPYTTRVQIQIQTTHTTPQRSPRNYTILILSRNHISCKGPCTPHTQPPSTIFIVYQPTPNSQKTPTKQPTTSITNHNTNIPPQPKDPNYILFNITIYLLHIYNFEPTMNRIKTKSRLHLILKTTIPLQKSHIQLTKSKWPNLSTQD